MTEQVEKTADAAAPLMAKLGEYLDAAQAVVLKYAPDVWDATLTIIRIQSIFSIVLWVACCTLSVWGFRYAKDIHQQNLSINWADRPEWPFALLLFSCLVGISCVIAAALGGFSCVLGAFAPDLAVLYSLGSKAGLF
jgi:hypothetical protein